MGNKIAMLSCIGSLENTRNYCFIQTLASLGNKVVCVMPVYADCKLPQGVDYRPLPHIQHFFFPSSTIGNLVMAILERMRNLILASRIALTLHPDICLCIEPDSWLIAMFLKTCYSTKIVIDLQEIYEDRHRAFPKAFQSVARFLLNRWLTFVASHADYVIHVSSARQERFLTLPCKSTVISLYPDLNDFPNQNTAAAKRTQKIDGIVTLIHSGALRQSYASEQLIEAMAIVHQVSPAVKLKVLGGIAGTLRNLSVLQELIKEGCVELYDRVPFSEVIRHLNESDIGISLVLPIDTTHVLAQPSKLYEYFAAGLPVIVADVPTLRKVVVECDCGQIVDPYNPADIARAIVRLVNDGKLRSRLGTNARKAAEERYNWTQEGGKLRRIINELQNRGEGE